MANYQRTQINPIIGRVVSRPILGVSVPPPTPDFLFTGYTGFAGFLEAALVLTVTSSAAWVGIRAGLAKGNCYVRSAGWIGGVGSALIGLLYLGGKSGLTQGLLPAVRVTPS